MSLFKSTVEKNIAQLEQEIVSWLDDVWKVSGRPFEAKVTPGWLLARESSQTYHVAMTEALRRLTATFGADKLGELAADMYFNPVHWYHDDPIVTPDVNWRDARIVSILNAALVAHPPHDLLARIEQRLKQMLDQPGGAEERVSRSDLRAMLTAPARHREYLTPRIPELFDMLLTLPPSPDVIDLVERIMRGDFNRIYPKWKLSYPPYNSYAASNALMHFQEMLVFLARHGRLTYDLFRTCALNLPTVLQAQKKHAPPFTRRFMPEGAVADQLADYTRHLLDEIAASLDDENYRLVIEADNLPSTSENLVRAVRYLTARKIGKIKMSDYHVQQSIEGAIARLARAAGIPADETERATLIGRLREFPAQSLKALLPHAGRARVLLCGALGWQGAEALVEQIAHISGKVYPVGEYSNGNDLPNTPDPTCGVIDVNAVRGALAEAGEKLTRDVLKAFSDKPNTCLLIEAVAGRNRDKLTQRIVKHAQNAIKAYGALPLLHEDEALERYLTLRQIGKEGHKYGAQRRATHAGAVQAALANLAQVAGYADAGRFEWDMEARLAEEAAAPGKTWAVGDYTVQLAVDGADASVAITRGGKAIKTPPKDVRASDAYQEAKAAVTQLRAQASRLRAELIEGLIASGELIARDELVRLLRLPAARAMLPDLIFHRDDGVTGLFDPDAFALRALDGTLHPYDQPARLAHSYHLYHASVLAAWQRHIVQQRIVQPVKQAYRELYLLTPAERETATHSNRFAGHSIDGSIAGRLFAARGWRIETGDGVLPYKVFGNIRAAFSMADAYYYLSRDMPVTTDQVYFEPHPLPSGWWSGHENARLKLEDVSPLVFSEVMRDADLIVSVAQQADEARLSDETYMRRAELVTTLLDDLGLSGVRVEGHHAHVKGKLANYRVHLGSAVIHLDPGNYLCIVPAKWGRTHEKLFLPFADADAKTSEVISKILLLLNDDKIKDESILRQIRWG